MTQTLEQDLVFRLRKRAEIRRQIPGRKSVQEGKADRIADILEEAATEIESLRQQLTAHKQISSVDYLDGPMIKMFRDD